MFDTDFEAADDLLTEAFGVAVEVERSGSPPTDELTAEVIVRDYEVTSEETGLPETIQFRDYLFARAEYVVAGEAVEPQRGDVIRQTIAGVRCEFTVCPIDKRPAAEWADAGGSRWLVHTKKTGTQT